MANDYQKLPLSASTNGMGIKIVQTATAGDLLHTATSDSGGSIYDEVWLWAYNSDTTARLLTIEFGDATAPDHNTKVTVPVQSGQMLVIPGFILNNGKTVKAFAATTNVITITGYVNRITHS